MYKASKSVEKGITSVENRVLDIGLEDLMGVDEFFYSTVLLRRKRSDRLWLISGLQLVSEIDPKAIVHLMCDSFYPSNEREPL
jgi:hypothetical protein